MAIRAVDIALPMQRSTEMTRAQTGEQRPDIQQQQFADRISKETQLKEETVQQTPQSEDAEVNPDGKGHGRERKGSKKNKKEEQQKQVTKKTSDSMWDITI